MIGTKFEQAIQEELLTRSQKFSRLCYYLMIVNGPFAVLACGLLLIGKIHRSAISAVTGFGSTALARSAGKEARHSLKLLIDRLDQLE